MEQLEPRSESASETSWIPLALREGGVPYELLFQIYDELFRSRVSRLCLCFRQTRTLLILDSLHPQPLAPIQDTALAHPGQRGVPSSEHRDRSG